MNIVLLSGGSGKRLWPLSNDVRSKQFLKLFKNENNEYESMLQRVYKQIKNNTNANIVIATNKAQTSSILNQLENKVNICIEPTRKDTFPAILLSCAYLKYELGVSDEECVCVCPVDPYVSDSYYQTVQSLEKYVVGDQANIVLMGIEPTRPSEQYGYIIPKSYDKVSEVLEFREKPTEEIAKKYIERNALWNAGVFGFKLKYVLDIGHKMIGFSDYRDLYQKYESLEKISFDYAVVEKEKNILVVRYKNNWDDVGTWSAMTQVMTDKTLGNVKLDEFSKNTHVINELNIPIVGMGLNDMVVVASADGILVSAKNRCDKIKPYVENLDNNIKFAEKSWGKLQVIDATQNSLTSKITIKKGKRMSYHHHEFREEVWTIVSGEGIVIVDGIKKQVKSGDVIKISIGCNHSIKALTELTIVEVQIGEYIKADKIKQEIEF